MVSLLLAEEPFVCGEESGEELPLVDVCCLCSFDRILVGAGVEGVFAAALCRLRLEPPALLAVGVAVGEEERRRRLRGRSWSPWGSSSVLWACSV